MASPRVLMVVALVILLAVGLWLWSAPDDPDIDPTGPRQGDGPPVYLFQAYDCAACWDLTTDGTLDAIRNASAGRTLIWKNVAGDAPYAAMASSCVWDQMPEAWADWNHATFTAQRHPGDGWATQDRITYHTETTLTLSQAETQTFEACMHGVDAKAQVDQDTEAWDQDVALPALYADGRWLPATPEAMAGLAR